MSGASSTENSTRGRCQQIALTASGLEQASVIEPESFVFVIGESVYRCSRFQAAFLSKTVADLFLTDPFITQYVIDDIPDPENLFGLIWHLLRHGTVELAEGNLSTLQQFTHRLRCEELDRRLFEFQLSGEDLTVANAVARLLLKSDRLLPIDGEVEFIASRLDEIDSLDRLSLVLLEIILESRSLRIETEDWLLDLICGLGSEYENLIGYVRCEFLSAIGIAKFVETIEIEQIHSVLWNSICSRLQNTCSSSPDLRRLKSRRFPHAKSDLEGIIHHLSLKCGGNVHTKGLVTITASSSYSGQQPVETIANFGQPSNWVSYATPNSWVMFDFKEPQVSIEGYSVNSGPVGYWLLTWEMEASDDASSWRTIHGRSTKELVGVNHTRYFACNSASKEFHRYVRIRQTGVNHNNSLYLEIGSLELFGRLRLGTSAK
jgi:hypothetical protein